MTTGKWDRLARLLDAGATPLDLPRNIESIIAGRLDEALGQPSRTELDAIKAALAEFFQGLLARAPEDAAAAVRGAPGAPDAAVAAFWLGQIGFAQHFAAEAAERRADDRFAEIFKNPVTLTYLRPLLERDHTGRELAQVLGFRPETVSRKLVELRELGIVDFRRDGTSLYNFLTPQARSALETSGGPEPLLHRDPLKVRLVKQRRDSASEAFRDHPVLGH